MPDPPDSAVCTADRRARLRERPTHEAGDDAPRGGRSGRRRRRWGGGGWWWRRRWRRRRRGRRRRRRPGCRDPRVVDVRLRNRSGVRPRVGPGDVRAVLSVECQRHPIAEEAGLDRVLGRRHVRHGRRRHARVVEGRAFGGRVADLGQRDVVAAGRLAVAVRAVVERDEEPASVRRHPAPRLPLRRLAEARIRPRRDRQRLAPGLALVRRVRVEDIVVARRGSQSSRSPCTLGFVLFRKSAQTM